MPEQEHQRQSNKPPKGSRSRRATFFLVTLLILGLAGAGLYLFTSRDERSTSGGTRQEEIQPAQPALKTAQEEATTRILEAATEEETAPGTDSLAGDAVQQDQCAVLAKSLHGFFQHVDQQEYLAPFSLNSSSQAHFIALANKLLANPPVVSREADDLYTILQNMAHFFRVIGKDNILIIKAILDRERDKIEDVAEELFLWVTAEGCREELLPFSPSLAEVYEYAGFFLNTMGGRSYLFRRDSRSRLLVNYYSILIVDRANGLGINHHGIDISQPIPQLIEEIDSSTQLLSKETYLDRLYQLQEKH
ncbi:MAG: hypothetical protein ACYDBT_02560 [Desulfobulbaceae bacterium]